MKSNRKKKTNTCFTTRLSQKVYERDFYSHVAAKPVRYIGLVLEVKEVDLVKLRKDNNYSDSMMSCVLTFILSCDQQCMSCAPITVVEEKKVLK